MKIDLKTDETAHIVVDGTCEFKVWGERNEEGTMVMKYMKYNALCVKVDSALEKAE